MKLQGAILFIFLNIFDEEKLNSLFNTINNDNESIRSLMKILISSINPNYIYIHH